MREIKFRAWDPCADPPCMYNSNVCEEYAMGDLLGGEMSIMQYTGLKDKNGTEIYEGDIVEGLCAGRENMGEVIFSKRGLKFCVRTHKRGTYGKDVPVMASLIGTRVIGNIYENPDLLE